MLWTFKIQITSLCYLRYLLSKDLLSEIYPLINARCIKWYMFGGVNRPTLASVTLTHSMPLARILGNHSFSTYARFSEKLTFLTSWYAHERVRNVRNVSFPEKLVYVLNEWSPEVFWGNRKRRLVVLNGLMRVILLHRCMASTNLNYSNYLVIFP